MATEQEIRRRATEAQRLLDEPMLAEVFTRLEHQAIEQLLATNGAEPVHDAARRMLADRVNAIRGLRAALRSAIADGVSAAQQPDRWA